MAKKSSKLKRYVYVCAAVFVVVAVLLFQFIYSSEDVGHAPGSGRPDAIVVLTGGRGRSDYGLTLLRKGVADNLIISGVSPDVRVEQIFLTKLTEDEKKKIIVDKKSTNTLENAIEVKKIMAQKGFKSMELLTSNDHMKRAALIFKRRMPLGFDIRYTRDPLLIGLFKPNFDGKLTIDNYVVRHIAYEFVLYYAYVTLDLLGVL